MKNFFYIVVFFCQLLLYSCHSSNSEQTLWVSSNDTALKLFNGYWNYHDKLFSGIICERYPNRIIKSVQAVANGRQQRVTETFYPDGKKESWRWYKNGEKDSVNMGWWPDGNKKFEYHFNNGNYDGFFTEWYNNKQMIQQVLYKNGDPISGKGWRENGRVYMNFVKRNCRYYGMMNSNLCYSLKQERIQ